MVEPEGRRGLEAAAQRVQQAARDVALGQPELRGHGPVDVDGSFGLVEDLREVHVDRARDLTHLLARSAGDAAVAPRADGAHDLHVDGRGQAEVEDLA